MAKDNNQAMRMPHMKSAAIATMIFLTGSLFLFFGTVSYGNSQEALAQQQGQQTGNATTISNTTTTKTFTAKGIIAGLIPQGAQGNQSSSSAGKPYLTGGNWDLQAKNGNITNFKSNFTMVKIDGSDNHRIDVMNFKVGNKTNFQLDPKGRTIINGTADYAVNGTTKWPGVDTTLTIEKATIFTIQPNEKDAKQHFQGQPIYGITLAITGENGTKIATTIPAGGNQTHQGGGGPGGIIGNITKGLENLFGGGGKK